MIEPSAGESKDVISPPGGESGLGPEESRREATAAIWRYGKVALRIVLPLAILVLVWHEVRNINLREVRENLGQAKPDSLLLACAAAAAGIMVMGFYDLLCFRSTAALGAWRRWTLGMLLFAWTNFLTLGPIGGPALRLFFYRKAGMPTGDILRGLAGLYLGFFAGLAAWIVAAFIPLGAGPWGMAGRTGLAVALAGPIAMTAWKAVTWWRKRRAVTSGEGIPLIRLGMLGALDWGCMLLVFRFAGDSLGVTLSAEELVKTVMLGHAAGLASLLPGGVGSADAVWLKMLMADGVAASDAAAMVFLFRLVFYIAPWAVSTIALYLIFAGRWAHAERWQRRVIAGAMVLNALFLLLSAATPAVKERLRFLNQIAPIDAMEASHWVAVLAATIMLFLVRGLLRGYRSAYLLAAGALAASTVAHILKAGDFEESIVCFVLLVLLLGARGAFRRRGRLPVGWEVTAAAALGSLAFFLLIGYGTFRHVHILNTDLYFRFEPGADKSRYLRGLLAVAGVGMVFVIRQAAMPQRLVALATDEQIDRARDFLRRYAERASALNVLCGDKGVWFWRAAGSRDDGGLVVFQRQGDKMIVFCDPVVADPAQERAFLEDLHAFADNEDLDLAFYQISERWMGRLHDFGYTFFKLGEEAVMDLNGFSLAGGERRAFRKIVSRVEAEGVSFRVCEPPHAPDLIDQCRDVSDEWLREKGIGEMQFSLGYFSYAYLQRCPIGAAYDRDGRVVAFVNLLLGRPGSEATYDLVRYRVTGVDNVMDYVIIRSALWATERGSTALSLGMSPLLEVGGHKRASVTERLARLAFEHGERIYNYRGMHRYKEKFHPRWEPRFLAYPKPWDWAAAVVACTGLIMARSREARERIRAARDGEA